MKENSDAKETVQELLKEILAKDINLLSNRDLSNLLENKAPGSIQRDVSTVKKALQSNINIGELFLKAHMENTQEAKDEAKNKAIEALRQNNMPEKKIQKVIDIFVYALEWNKPKETVKEETEEPAEETASQTKQETDKKEQVEETVDVHNVEEVKKEESVSSRQNQLQKENEGKTWICSCGRENDKNFCSLCGKPRPSETKNSEKWICPFCGKENDKNFCFFCGHERPKKLNGTESRINTPIQPESTPIPTVTPPRMQQPRYEQRTQQSTANAAPQPQYNSNTANTKKSSGNMLGGIIIGIVLVFAVLIGVYIVDGSDDSSSGGTSSGIMGSTEKKEIPPVQSDLSLGGLALGYSIDQMHDILGKETSIDEKGIYKFYNYSDIQVGIKNEKVDALVSNSSAVATKRGIHQGSTLQEVFDKYGDNYNKMDYDDLTLYEYTFAADNGKNGILRFAINKSNSQVNYISVRIPEEESAPAKPAETVADTSNEKNAKEAAQALSNYYAAITRHDMNAAYNILSNDMQTHMGSLDVYADGYKTTLSDHISNVQVTSNSGDKIAFSYTLTARDSYNRTSVKEQTFACTALLSKQTGSWHIVDMSAKKQGERIVSR